MFGLGVQELLTELPRIGELDDATARRLLSGAWLEVAERRELGSPEADMGPSADELRRLAAALQTHAVVMRNLSLPTTRACAFVAAEALDIARELSGLRGGGDETVDVERVVVGLLYLVAGYDANASVSVRDVAVQADAPPEQQYAVRSILALLNGGSIPDAPSPDTTDDYLHERVRAALWRKVGDLTSDFTRWLRDPARPGANEPAELLELADELRLAEDDIPVAAHADIQHLARLASSGLAEARQRALRGIHAPEGATDTFARFLRSQCARQPLLWPAAAEYAHRALPGPAASAVVAVPTGAGKSGVADLALQHAITHGWVLYLAPTNALVGQIRRQLRRDHPGVVVREFLGGAEYTTLAGEDLADIADGQVLVMTPEKCSLALRQSPEAFADLALLVFDEAHLLGDHRGRGVLSELVLAEILARSNRVTLLLMSALIANPEALAEWFAQVQDTEVIVIREPWRPTRTLRAVVGVDRTTLRAAAQEPRAELAALPVRRRNVGFEAPLAVLAGLRGPWSSSDPDDYSVVQIGATTPMKVTRPRGGGDVVVDMASVGVRPTVAALAQLLGDRGQKVMAFLPRSKHDSFLAALSLRGFGEVEVGATAQALLSLSSAELGVESLLATVLTKGVGVHTSALLTDERRASELAFDEGNTAVLFATGTLAQGLNLPATTVIIGGTDIGYDPDQTAAEKRRQQRSQLLNAIGRAGRARVAARSLALVVPSRLPLLDADTVVDVVLPRAEFLAEEDASTQLSSALRPFLARVQSDTVDVDDLWASDHLAIAYLASADEDTLAPAVLARTWAAHQISGIEHSAALASAIAQLGRQALDADGGPAWASEAAHRAGVALPIAARFAVFVTGTLTDDEFPASVVAWVDAMISAIREVPPADLGLLLQRDAFRSTALADCWSEDASEREAGLAAMRATLRSWLAGDTLAVVGGAAHGAAPLATAGRGQRDPIPRTIRLIDTGIGFGLTRAAGLLAATLDVAVEQGAIESPGQRSRAELERLPVALRFGASGRTALAFLRAGARPRVIAHLLAERLGAPPEASDDDALLAWASEQIANVVDRLDEITFDDDERQLVAQFLIARAAR